MKLWIAAAAALLIETHALAQNDPNSAAVFYPSCLAAADIVQRKTPAADSVDAAKQLGKAAICFGAIAAIKNLQPYFKSEFAVCQPKDKNEKEITAAEMVLAVTAHLKKHPEQRGDNFHRLAVTALAATWPCPK